MCRLNEYEAKELEALQLSLAIAYQVNCNANGKGAESNKIIKVWSDRVSEALRDAEFKEQELPYETNWTRVESFVADRERVDVSSDIKQASRIYAMNHADNEDEVKILIDAVEYGAALMKPIEHELKPLNGNEEEQSNQSNKAG